MKWRGDRDEATLVGRVEGTGQFIYQAGELQSVALALELEGPSFCKMCSVLWLLPFSPFPCFLTCHESHLPLLDPP